MRKHHKKRLAKLALALLKNRKKVNFFMGSFAQIKINGEWESDPEPCQVVGHVHECGTTCCFLGYAPAAFADDKSFLKAIADTPEFTPSWDVVSNWVIGQPRSGDLLWLNLFGASWQSDPVAACQRALLALENPKKAEEHDWFDEWRDARHAPSCVPAVPEPKKITIKELKRRLETFL